MPRLWREQKGLGKATNSVGEEKARRKRKGREKTKFRDTGSALIVLIGKDKK